MKSPKDLLKSRDSTKLKKYQLKTEDKETRKLRKELF